MILHKYGYTLDVDVENTLKYSKEHTLCDCDEDRNLYAQIADKFPKLKEIFASFAHRYTALSQKRAHICLRQVWVLFN